ncbi:MAG TPA: polysaccharide biosynthesis/export family protein [Rhizomicrobium sp.]|nr:polysaccharide biosynthesis/export family protein [Rhizomicrobium sp.]
MGRSVSLTLVRLTAMLISGMLLFAVFGHAHAENLDGYGLTRLDPATNNTPYGLKPLPDDAPASPSTANNSYNAAPVGGGYNPPAPYGYVPVPGSAPAAGFAPAPPQVAANTYQPAQYQPVPYQPAPAQSVQALYGYKPEAGPVTPPTPAYPAYPVATSQPVDAYAYYQPQQGEGGTRANPDYMLGTGDKVKLTVFGETDLSGDYTIDGSGNLSLPLIGQVRAAGYTASQLEGVIGSAFSRGYLKSPRVSVEVSTYRPFYIIGAVNRPGQYPYVDHMNALNAVALAGGFTTSAVESVIFVRREGTNQEVELPTDRSTEIRPGDVIRVHNTFFSDAMNLFSPLTGVAGTAALITTFH